MPSGQATAHPLALSQLTVLGATPLETIDVAADAGYDAVTLRIADGTGAPNPLFDDVRLRARAADRLRDRDLVLLDVEVLRLRPDGPATPLAPLLEGAAELGARHLLVVGQDPDADRTADAFAAVAAEAAAVDIRAVFEFMVFSGTRTLADAWEAVERSDPAANAGILVDALHLARSGGTPGEVAELAARRPDRFPYAQLCDGPAVSPGPERSALYEEAVEARLHPGDGDLPLRDLVAALPAGTPLSVEAPTRATAGLAPAERARQALAAARAVLVS